MQELTKKVYFITGIDTDAGKSYATAFVARSIASEGRSVITQKFIQTGCIGISEDIETHRRLMGVPLESVDLDGTTCPEMFAFASSPHLAARLEGREVDLLRIEQATARLSAMYDVVLIEGAGGLMVPISGFYTTADYIAEHSLPVMLVSSARLGSINHTLLTLEVCRARGIEVEVLLYNEYPVSQDTTIAEDTYTYLQQYLAEYHPRAILLRVPVFEQL